MKKPLEDKFYELVRKKGTTQQKVADAINEGLPRLSSALKNKDILKKAITYLETLPDKEWNEKA